MTSLSIIIVNYKTPQLVVDCIHSIKESMTGALPEIVVVDNYSQDNSREMITTVFPELVWIQMEYNSGFARGNNAGIRAASGELLLLLNSDTLVEGNAIGECAERLRTSSYMAAGVQLLNVDRSPQISGNFFMKGGLNHLMSIPYLGRFIRAIGLAMKVKKTNVAKAEGVVEVDWINGAFLMVKRSVIETAGLLDEDFFLYAEEIEWCSRIRKKGKLCIYGDLNVVHFQGASAAEAFNSTHTGYTKLSDRKGFQLMVSGLLRIRKQFGTGWFLFHFMTFLFNIPVYFIIALIRTILFQPGRKMEWADWWGYSKNSIGLFRFLTRIISNRPYFYKVL